MKEVKSVATERFIRIKSKNIKTLKKKIYKYVTSVSKK